MSEPQAPAERGAGAALWIVVGLALLAIAAFWVGLRLSEDRDTHLLAFPIEEGRLVLAGLEAPVDVVRDGRGVPHLRGASRKDLWYAMGFVHAQDRLAQMLWLRRLAEGRIAEVIGAEGLGSDRLSRTLDLAGLAKRQLEELPESTRGVLEAYARGVNARLDRVRQGRVAMPVALADGGVPEAWTPVDTVAVQKLLAWSSGPSLETALVLSDLIERLGGLGARPFFPVGSGVRGVGVPVGIHELAEREEDLRFGRDGLRAPERRLRAALLGGSGWVLSAERSAAGAPILAAELHAPARAPALIYELHLATEDWQASGASVPGLPVLWAGRNADVAWVTTSAGAVTADLFSETLRPGDPSRYHNGSRWVKVRERVETIRVRSDDPVEPLREESITVRSTHHGPLVNELLEGDREPLALAWSGALAGDGLSGLLSLPDARSAEDVLRALRTHHEPAIALVYADRAGAAGVQVAGWIPERILPTSLVPVPGRMRAFAWESPVEFEVLPARELGESGPDWVAASDQAWFPALGEQRIEWLWRPGQRAARIDALVEALARRGGVRLADAAAVQVDRVAPGADALIQDILMLAGDREELGPETREILRLLQNWDRQMRPESAGALTYQLFLERLVRELFEAPMGPGLFERYRGLTGARSTAVAAAALRQVTQGGVAEAWADPERVRSAVRRSLRETWASVSYRLGPNRERWSWGRLHQVHFAPLPPLRSLDGPAIAEREALGPRPAGGDFDTLALADFDPAAGSFQVRHTSVYRMAVDLSTPDAYWSGVAPGQSEHPGHPHAADGIDDWEQGRLRPRADEASLDEDPEFRRLRLEPAS